MPNLIYLGLFGPEGELRGNGYHRIELRDFQIQDSLHGERVTTHIGDVEFPSATGNWGTITGFGIFDSQDSLLFRGFLDRVTQVQAGDTVRMPSELHSSMGRDKPTVDLGGASW
jgi:hypothetical protein